MMRVRPFILPKDFTPDTIERYTTPSGIDFEVRLQNIGLLNELNEDGITRQIAPVLRWHFAIYVMNTLFEAGQFHWDPSDKSIANEEICSHIASSYGNRIEKKNVRHLTLVENAVQVDDHQFIVQAMALVWTVHYDNTVSDNIMDVLFVSSYTALAGNRCVLFGVKQDATLTYEVTYESDSKKTHLTSYIQTDYYCFTDDQLTDDSSSN